MLIPHPNIIELNHFVFISLPSLMLYSYNLGTYPTVTQAISTQKYFTSVLLQLMVPGELKQCYSGFTRLLIWPCLPGIHYRIPSLQWVDVWLYCHTAAGGSRHI